jgi:hypothetical protein
LPDWLALPPLPLEEEGVVLAAAADEPLVCAPLADADEVVRDTGSCVDDLAAAPEDLGADVVAVAAEPVDLVADAAAAASGTGESEEKKEPSPDMATTRKGRCEDESLEGENGQKGRGRNAYQQENGNCAR